MKIVTAIDSMKGSLTSKQANQIIVDIFADDEIEVTAVAIADGGEGTVDSIVTNTDGEWIETRCRNLFGEEIMTKYGWLEKEKTAIIETATTCGIHFLDSSERTHPLYTNSTGLGEQILSAIQNGAQKIIIGLGGTGTIDGGLGVLSHLGVEFFDANGQLLKPIPLNFTKINYFSTKNLFPGILDIEYILAADVTSVISGQEGAVQLYGAQKGLKNEEIASFETAMIHYSQKILAGDISQAGDGAAGGLGMALRKILKAKMVSGLDLISEYSHLESLLDEADLVVTGEGKIDAQSLQGKVPVGISMMAKSRDIPVLAFVGSMQGEIELFEKYGLSVVVPIVNEISTLTKAMQQAEENLRDAAMRTKKLLFLLQ